MPAELAPWVERVRDMVPPSAERPLQSVRVDFTPEHRQPSAARVLAATVAALIGSLVADATLAKLGQMMFPATKGYSHFHFSDYAKLTVIGVIIACVAWPMVTRISSDPRWLFFRQAIAVTLVLFVPDLWILYKGQPVDAVAVLMVMHVAIALVTYNALVHIAKVQPAGTPGRYGAHAGRRAYGGAAEDDYGYGEYARQDDGRQDDYGHEDYGQDDYFPGDRRPEPARRYPGYPGHREQAAPAGQAYEPGYREPDSRRASARYGAPDDQYQGSYQQPDDRYQASYRRPEGRHQASHRQPDDRYRGRYDEPDARYGARSTEPDDPYEAYFRKPADPYEDRQR